MVLPLVTNIFKRSQLKAQEKPRLATPPAVWQDLRYFIAFGLGSGAMPFAPGTFGTLLAIPFYLCLQHLSLASYLIFVLLFIAASAWLSEIISREIHIHDHPGMNIDEFAGFFVTMIHAPPGITWIILGFILFRLFDIWKPWPIGFIDKKVHGGLGMILDDVIAGLFAMIIMQVGWFL